MYYKLDLDKKCVDLTYTLQKCNRYSKSVKNFQNIRNMKYRLENNRSMRIMSVFRTSHVVENLARFSEISTILFFCLMKS